MAEIKLKVISASGDTLAVSRAGESVSLVHTAPYADGDWIALECDELGLYCVVQLEDTMPRCWFTSRSAAWIFQFRPPITVSITTRAALPAAATCCAHALPHRRRLQSGATWRSIRMTATVITAFTRTPLPTWKLTARPCLPPATRWTAFMNKRGTVTCATAPFWRRRWDSNPRGLLLN